MPTNRTGPERTEYVGVAQAVAVRHVSGPVVGGFTATFNDQAACTSSPSSSRATCWSGCPVHQESMKSRLALLVAGCFILPFLIFSPLAGVLADRLRAVVDHRVLEGWSRRRSCCWRWWRQSLPQWFDPNQPAASQGPLWSGTGRVVRVPDGRTQHVLCPRQVWRAMPEILDRPPVQDGLLEGTSFMAQNLRNGRRAAVCDLQVGDRGGGGSFPDMSGSSTALLLELAS